MTEREAAALAALDVRIRQAVDSLREAVETQATEWTFDQEAVTSRNGADDGVGELYRASTEPHGDDSRGNLLVGEAPRRRRLWAAAAAVLAVVASVGALLVSRGDDQPTAVTDVGPPSGYLVPDWLPEGWETRYAHLGPQPDGPDVSGDVAVYGDGSLEDPWSGPVLAAYDAPSWFVGDDREGEEIEIGGQPAKIRSDVDLDQVVVTVGSLDDSTSVVGYGFISAFDQAQARALVIDVAEDLDRGVIPAAALPDGYRQISAGPLAAMGSFAGRGVFDGLALSYNTSSSADPGIGLGQQPVDDPSATQLIRLVALGRGTDVEEIEVRGQPAYRLTFGDAVVRSDVIQWYEPTLDLVVTVVGYEVDWSTVERFVDGLRVGTQDELEDLLDRYGELPDGRDSDVDGVVTEPGDAVAGEDRGEDVAIDGGEVGDVIPESNVDDPRSSEGASAASRRVIEGEYEGDPWSITVLDWNTGARDIEFSFDEQGGGVAVQLDDHRQSTVGSSLMWPEHEGALVLGTVDPSASDVVVQTTDDQTFEMDIYDVDGWAVDIFVGFVPLEGVDVEIIARDRDGQTLDGWPRGDVLGSMVNR